MRQVDGKHLLFGPDGSRRYALRSNLTYRQAYAQIPDVCTDVCRWCLTERRLSAVSLWLLQENNLSRDHDTAMLLAELVLQTVHSLSEDARLSQEGINLVAWSPELDRVRPGTVSGLKAIERRLPTREHPKINVILAYNQDREIRAAMGRCRSLGLEPDFDTLSKHWCIPPVDVFVRTGQPAAMSNISAYWPHIERGRILSTEVLPQELTRDEFGRLLTIYEEAVDSVTQSAGARAC